MDLIKNKKRGELSTQQIVGLILLITSFAIILFFLFRLDLGQQTNKQICHNSVLMLAQPSIQKGNVDCKTNYVCISGGDDCENFNEDTKINVDKKNKEQILKKIANEMSDCWWMFGEGRIDYLGRTEYAGYHCAICSTIMFDQQVQEASITYRDLYEFLEDNEKSNGESYLKYLYNSFYADDFVSRSAFLTGNYESELSLNEKFIVLTGRNKDAGDDRVIPVYLIKSDQIGETPCEVFDITKA